MKRTAVAILGTNHRDKLAVLGLGNYTGLWDIRHGQFTNTERIEGNVTGRGVTESIFLIDGLVVAFSAPLGDEDRKTFDRYDSQWGFPAYAVQLSVPPMIPLDEPVRKAIRAALR